MLLNYIFQVQVRVSIRTRAFFFQNAARFQEIFVCDLAFFFSSDWYETWGKSRDKFQLDIYECQIGPSHRVANWPGVVLFLALGLDFLGARTSFFWPLSHDHMDLFSRWNSQKSKVYIYVVAIRTFISFRSLGKYDITIEYFSDFLYFNTLECWWRYFIRFSISSTIYFFL